MVRIRNTLARRQRVTARTQARTPIIIDARRTCRGNIHVERAVTQVPTVTFLNRQT